MPIQAGEPPYTAESDFPPEGGLGGRICGIRPFGRVPAGLPRESRHGALGRHSFSPWCQPPSVQCENEHRTRGSPAQPDRRVFGQHKAFHLEG